jgi:hypothetical protein
MMLDVMEETQLMFTNTLLPMELLIHHANNMLLTTSPENHASQLISVKIAHGHHALRVKTAKTHVGLLTTRNIMFPFTTVSPVSKR